MIYSDWLPPKVVEEAKEKEKQRFATAVAAFKQAAAVAAAEAARGNPNAYAAVLGQLMDDIKTLVSTKTLFAPAAIRTLVYTLYDVVLATAADIEVQVRTGELLSHVLRHHRHSQHLGLALPWRPLYDMLRGLYDAAPLQVKGTFLEHVQQSTLFSLVARARRFFAPGAATEIWSLLRRHLVYGDPMGTQTHLALGWLVLFFPTKQIPQTQTAVAQGWVGEWLGVWGRLVSCSYWDGHWMYLLARAVKDDWKGVVDWAPYMSQLYTHMLACFKVPVGTATAGCPSSISAPHRASLLFGTKLDQLLEQYCHPSNTGPWSGDLAVFLRHGVHYFMKVLGRQCGSAGWPGEQVIVAAASRRYVRAAVKLAARGQFSKRESLVSASCKALCHLSYVWPGAVLPLVLGRFQSALATATAMHQLPTSISTLALCVRPLLLAGWHTKEESTQQVIAEAMMAVLPGIDANDEAKTAAVFQFYTAVLSSIPALHGAAEEEDDAAPVYGSVEGGGSSMDGVEYAAAAGSNGSSGSRNAPVYRLPLYLDDWVDQVMERLFTLLGNLDTGPSHRGTDMQAKPELLLQSTHLGKDTMYHSFFQHLLLRLPPRLADHVVGLLGQFATERALPTVALEAASMFRSASIARPAAAVELVVKPLVARIRAQMPETGSRSLSRATEDSLTWSLVLLGSAVGGLRPAVAAPLVPSLEALVDDALKLPSRVAHNWASMVLSSLLGVLSGWFVPDRAWPQTGGMLLPNGLQLWVDRQGVGWSAPGLRRMLLWRCAQAAAKAAPPASPCSKPVTPGEAAAGSATPAGAVRLQQLPKEYLALFVELLALSMQPNAGVRGSAVPTLLACLKRFPCLVELMVPEVLAALAVIFRDADAFRGFLYALMASRCHSSNTCLKSIQMLIMQVISRFKLPPLLAVEGGDFGQLQASLMALAEPGARVNWRYSVLSNMVLMFAAPPAAATSSVPLLRHCLALLHSDMLLLRQVGGAGLWLLMAQMAAGGAAGNEALLGELKQALSKPGAGEALLKLLVLDHAKLDASEAAKGARGHGGGLGGSGGMLSGLLGMTAEEVLAAMVAAAVEKADRWPAEGGRPTATTDGLFEVSHARLIRLMALLCPAELSAALQQPLSSRLAAFPTPSGPQEKAEVAAVAESLAGLLAAAAPTAAAAAGGGGGGGAAGWAVPLLREALAGSSLEMSDAWSAALWYILDHLLSTVLDQQQQQQQQQQRSSGSGNSSIGGAVVVADAMEEEGHVKGVAGAVLGAGGSEAWSSRAAAMVFLQVFWFRHCYQLGSDDMERLQAFVVGRLQDSKVEVRGLSAATLSGIIKALPAHEMDSLRRIILANVTRLFNIPPPGSRGNKRGSSRGVPVVAAAAAAAAAAAQLDAAGAAAFAAQQGPVFLAEAQAVVQGLKAFVLSSPYDVPGWMPEVLLALVAAANSRNPLVRRDASKALSEFKRTHEEDALEQLRALLGEERWEALAQVTSSASYFV
ncbi:hypothetical protein OEZ86_006527 [Tetradesmus obliquus]|nr:hypothetical protein OEZ86_006527 [Tetradesmus obliquus]